MRGIHETSLVIQRVQNPSCKGLAGTSLAITEWPWLTITLTCYAVRLSQRCFGSAPGRLHCGGSDCTGNGSSDAHVSVHVSAYGACPNEG